MMSTRQYSPSNRVRYVIYLEPLLAAITAILAIIGISGCAGYTSAGTTQPQQHSSAILSTSPSVGFGNVSVGSSATQSLNIKNTGTAAVNISAATVSGAGFSWVGKNPSSSIPAGQSHTVQIQFAPHSADTVAGTLSITSDASKSPLTVSLSATGVQGALSVNPSTLDIGRVLVGSSASQTIPLTNVGTTGVTISAAKVSGIGFSISGLSTPLTINPGQNKTFPARFSTTSAGTASRSLSLTGNPPNSTLTIPLRGTGTSTALGTSTAPGTSTVQGRVFNVATNGAVPNSKEGYHCAIAERTTRLVCSDVTFASSDTHHAIIVYGAASNVTTTSTTAVSRGSVTVAPESMANIDTGTVLYCADANGSHGEQLVVTAVTKSTFTATFATSKTRH